jgi:hypothetical protein
MILTGRTSERRAADLIPFVFYISEGIELGYDHFFSLSLPISLDHCDPDKVRFTSKVRMVADTKRLVWSFETFCCRTLRKHSAERCELSRSSCNPGEAVVKVI